MVKNKLWKKDMDLNQKDELYNLKDDPMEINNLIDNPEYKETVLNMKERLLKFYMETSDFVPNKRDLR